MRSARLIKQLSPCDTDFADPGVQSRGTWNRVICPNFDECRKRSGPNGVQCARMLAKWMALGVLERRGTFESDLEAEKKAFLSESPYKLFWVCRKGEWGVVTGKEEAVDEIVSFVRVIIDMKPGERRPFTEDGKRLEITLDDARHNVVCDLSDMAGELGL